MSDQSLEAEQIARDIIKNIISSDVLLSPNDSIGFGSEGFEDNGLPTSALQITGSTIGEDQKSCASDSYSQHEWLQAADLPVDKEASATLCLDSEFVVKHLGTPLSLALTEILTKRPSDPIHYLGHWLLKWRWNQEQKQLQEDKVIALIAERKRIADDVEENLHQKEELHRRALQKLREEAELIAKEELELMFKNMQLQNLKPEGAEVELPGELEEPNPDDLGEEMRESDENLEVGNEDDI